MDLPRVPEPEHADDDPLPRAVREFDEPAPGNAGWVRVLAETAAAQREPFLEGEQRVRAIAPTHWEGAAGKGFLAERDRVLGEWRAAVDTHDEVVRLLDGHNTFVHELRHLWEADRGNPAARQHALDVHREATERLAEELHRRAAELDAVAARAEDQEPPETPDAEPEPDTEPEPEPDPEPEPGADPEPEPDPNPDPDPDPAPHPDPEPEQPEPAETASPAEPTPAMLVNAHLDAQVLNGEWRAWIPWDDEPDA
ncbi:hypothetical protein [Saccharothrix lopnurensis]|uniref:Uncharacterized protein n=1 Tax=Saccharothrix lopnurensis TaxID=1670621 RepID=A0ABW1NYB8_9PSEU